jgi:hypothetical protein
VPIKDVANEQRELKDQFMDAYYTCCGKSICGGCIQTFSMNWTPGFIEKCQHNFKCRENRENDEANKFK